MLRPSAVPQARHCRPYTGPSPPCSSAHSSQIVTPCSCSQATLVSPRRNHNSSYTSDGRWIFLVVTSGKPVPRSKRICCANSASVPVPVRSALCTPSARMRPISSRYCFIGRASPGSLGGPHLGRCEVARGLPHPVGPGQHPGAREDHRQRQHLSFREPAAREVADVLIRHAHELDEEARHAVYEQK